ncbi:sentrin-specific protease 2 isoform X2 [Elgaria multicarinata webbii]|uniref:sentrin-specific protease 2 isoform X2 n=1 Tax=Elgaria multicarinata webbii TaxID=159646 RepID=UPI002FCD2A76
MHLSLIDDALPTRPLRPRPMYQWLPEALRSWLFPPPSCRRDVEPSFSRPRKRRHRSTQSHIEDPGQEQAKRQKLGIFGTLTWGIASLIKLPSQLTAKYLQAGKQHAEATDKIFSNTSGTLADKQMEPTSGMQMFDLDKKARCITGIHPDVEVISDCHRAVTCLRHDCTIRKNSKKSHNPLQEDLQPWGLGTHRHLFEGSTLDTGRYLKKPHYTVEEGVQREEREKYKQLLEQEKEKSPKNHSTPTIPKHLDVQGYAHGSLRTAHYLEIDVPSFETPRNGVRNFGPLCSRRDLNRPMTVAERSSESKRLGVQKKESITQSLANDLSAEVSLRLNLSQEGSSFRRRSLVKTEEQKCLSLDKASECLPDLTEVINFYMNLLVERNKRPGFPVLYAFSTFFYPKLNSVGYDSVRRWTKEVDLFQHDMILVPIHIRVHWALVVIDMRRETIKYYDSMGQNGHRICIRLLQYLQEESKSKRNLDINVSSWTLYSVKPHEIPQQLNGSDCGMFTCKYAEFISRDKPIEFTQRHMPYYRKRMVWEILHQQLL